ncbi:PAS domain-containing protein [Mucilaginibacter sp. HMF5004]|uniref:PAS domain-containing sensor histidine kinase n=1 Tax=Mucilaginibacter rivuli TaxID=2857527 RepID=UPI001C5D4F42|nr:PAS domain-containing sensor histidine kinase [Mucilaginibacter rivuli]MBW4888730.1 PAS domain-containing protein [Mucilaginibacter rivuli]
MSENKDTSLGMFPIGLQALNEHYFANKQLHYLIESTNTGLWERNIETQEAWWSPKFCELLGYEYGEIAPSYIYFLEEIVYPDDRAIVFGSFQDHIKNRTPHKVEFRMLTKQGNYKWFETSGKAWPNEHGKLTRMIGAVTDIDQKKRTELRLKKDEFFLNETHKIANIGGWELDVVNMELTWSKEVFDIHELPLDSKPDLDTAINYYEPGYRDTISAAVSDAIKYCKPYDLEVKFRTAKNNVIWVRTKGVPVINTDGECIILRGIFQNINQLKLKELDLQQSLDLLSDHNKRLQNFAHIVSHNLRSHSGNLQFMVNIFDQNISAPEKEEVFGNIRSISESLATTIDHLNEIVKIQTDISKELKPVDFESIFKNIQSALDNNIHKTKAIICYDFSSCPTINYVPAYLESIFLNLLTNSLKYRHPDRDPKIICKSYFDKEHTWLTFEDNGLGIDLDKYKDKVFGMYKTFHQNVNAKGIGLFITRNQIESLGGSIHIESTVNVGTKFTIKLV